MTTPAIPGVDRDGLAAAIHRDKVLGSRSGRIADVALAYIAAHHECACDRAHDDEWVEVGSALIRPAHHECACDRAHDDEWVEVDQRTWNGLHGGERIRRAQRAGAIDTVRWLVHRDDLPDPDPRAFIARELGPAKADVFLGLLDEHGWTVTRKEER